MRFRAREFLLLAAGGAVAGIVLFIVMQLAFAAAGLAGEVVGFVAFLLWLASVFAVLVGLGGAVWRALSK